MPLPDAVSFEVAATAVESYATMLFALTRRTAVRPGEWVLVLGAGGGIGLAAVDVASSLGARVIAAASSPAKRAAAIDAGAQVAVDYQTEDLKEIGVPTLVLHGDDDQIVPYKDAGVLQAELIKNATLKIYPGYPHGMLTVHADVINPDVLAFIKS